MTKQPDLVTGATGFLGGHLVDALVAAGEPVRVLLRPGRDAAPFERRGIQVVRGDLTAPATLPAALRDVRFVYHCAAVVADHGPLDLFRAVNVDGVRALLDAAGAAGVARFVHVSSTDVYGHPDRPVGESAPFRLRGWPYGDTKIEGEQWVWRALREHGLPVTIVRPASIYGPRCVPFVMEVIELLRARALPRIGLRDKPAGLAYVSNVTDAMRLAARSESAVGEAFNISDGSSVSWRTYFDRLADATGLPRPWLTLPYPMAYAAGALLERVYAVTRRPGRPPLSRLAVTLLGTDQGFPIEKARVRLDYRPSVELDGGLARVAAWLRQAGHVA